MDEQGGFLFCPLFVIWELIYKRKYFLKSYFRTACLLLVATLLFLQSSISVQSNKYEINETGLALTNLVQNKNTIDSLFSLYFDKGDSTLLMETSTGGLISGKM